jgi:choline dehydrogenase-like flavoprotein
LRDQQTFLARGRRYVLAAGALENARLLLANGFGADLPSVGRYYMSHTYGTVMPVRLASPLSPQTSLREDSGVYVRRRFRLDEKFQEEAKVGNAIAYFGRPPADSMAVHRDPLTSAVAIGKTVRTGIRLGPGKGLAYLRGAKGDLRAHASVIARSDRTFWTQEVPLLYKRFGPYRRPLVEPKLNQKIQYLTYQGEHLPTRDSRVYLTRECDALDVPRLAMDVRFTEGDFATLEALHGSLSKSIEAAGGAAQLTPEETVANIRESMAHSFNSNAHNLGTTRMGTSKSDSVVDRDCKVHTLENLFVAGSSVFPTGGHANPTLSIVMLACRLADHLSTLDWK